MAACFLLRFAEATAGFLFRFFMANSEMPPLQEAGRPLFSVITVTYNATATLRPTLESVAAQTCRHYEHLIIDGASTDGTVEMALKFRNPQKRVLSSPDNGVYDAMNKGLAEAEGDYVVFLNAGDTFHSPDTLQRIADAIMDNDYPGVVYGQTELVDSSRRKVGERHLTAPEQLSLASFAEGMVVCHQAFVALRQLTGPFSCRYRFSADYEWCIRVLQHSKRNVYVGEVIADYLDEGLTTRNHRKSLVERFKIMAYYYGWPKAVINHLKFIPRYLRRRSRGLKQ